MNKMTIGHMEARAQLANSARQLGAKFNQAAENIKRTGRASFDFRDQNDFCVANIYVQETIAPIGRVVYWLSISLGVSSVNNREAALFMKIATQLMTVASHLQTTIDNFPSVIEFRDETGRDSLTELPRREPRDTGPSQPERPPLESRDDRGRTLEGY